MFQTSTHCLNARANLTKTHWKEAQKKPIDHSRCLLHLAFAVTYPDLSHFFTPIRCTYLFIYLFVFGLSFCYTLPRYPVQGRMKGVPSSAFYCPPVVVYRLLSVSFLISVCFA